jgi:hypothetical protein
MKVFIRHISIVLLLMASIHSYAQYTGGVNDGYGSSYQCLNSLNGGAASVITVSTISGPATVCGGGAQTYSITLSSGIATLYNWTVPAGASVISVSNTLISSIVSIQFGAAGGNVNVTASNQCNSTTGTALPVTTTICNLNFGGSNDGFADGTFCGSDLNGTALGAVLTGTVSGPSSTCSNGAATFTVALTSGVATLFNWSMPSDAVVISESNSLTTSTVSILLGTLSGTINVTASNQCTSNTGTGLAVSPGLCGPYFGGPNDGYASGIYCGNDLNGTVAAPITLSAVSGPAAFCSNGTELYSVNLLSGTATTYTWTGPTGFSLSATNNSLSSSQANITLGNASGNITVTAGNGCTSVTSATYVVTAATCNLDFGGANDGFSSAINCFNDLNGTSSGPIVLGPITGPAAFCANNNDGAYNISLSSGYSNFYSWTGPTGSSVVVLYNTLHSSIANFAFGAASGTIMVTASNGCGSVTSAAYAVTATSCNLSLGGPNDGFAFGPFCSNSLNGGAITPLALGVMTGRTSICANLGENYTVPVTSGAATLYSWSGPAGSSVATQVNATTQGMANILFGGVGGTVLVTVSNSCSSVIDSLPNITANACNQTFGGANDGFAMAVSVIGSPLPVEWLYFSATPDSSQVNLNWATATEINNAGFDIERSADGIYFTYLQSVPAHGNGNSTTTQTYKSVDKQPLPNTSYYRLKQLDINGVYKYSVIVPVNFNQSSFIEVFPNPASTNLFMHVSKEYDHATIKLVDALGREVLSQTIYSSDINSININLLAPGVYYMMLNDKAEMHQSKIIISK